MVDFVQPTVVISQHILQFSSCLNPTVLVFDEIEEVEEDWSVQSEGSSGEAGERNEDLSDEDEYALAFHTLNILRCGLISLNIW